MADRPYTKMADVLILAFLQSNKPLLSCGESHYESEAKCKTIHLKIKFCLQMNEN